MKIKMKGALITYFSGFNRARISFTLSTIGAEIRLLSMPSICIQKRALFGRRSQIGPQRFYIHPTEKNVQAVAFYYDRIQWKILDPSIQPEIDLPHNLEEGDMNVVSHSLDDKVWIVVFTKDNGPARYYRYDREEMLALFLSTDREKRIL